MNFPVSLGTGEELTFPVPDDSEVRSLTLEWGRGSDCGFQILYTAGGGQFLPIADFSAEKGRQVCRFAPVSASELKIVVTDGHGILKNVRID